LCFGMHVYVCAHEFWALLLYEVYCYTIFWFNILMDGIYNLVRDLSTIIQC